MTDAEQSFAAAAPGAIDLPVDDVLKTYDAIERVRLFPPDMQAIFSQIPYSLWPTQAPKGAYSYSLVVQGIQVQVLLRARQLFLDYSQTGEKVRRSFSFGQRSDRSFAKCFQELQAVYYGES